MSLNSLTKPDVDKVSQLIRTRISKDMDLVSEIKKDMKQAYLQDNRNKFDFYDVRNNIVVPRKIVPKHLPQNFQSIHHITNPETKKRAQTLFQEPKYNALQTEAIKEIEQGGCRVHVLSNIYKEFTSPTKSIRSKSTKATPQGHKKVPSIFEAREVEDLENWTYEKISGTKIRHNHEIEELKKEVNRMMLFIEEDCVTQRDKTAVNCMFEDLAICRSNERFAQSILDSDRNHKDRNELPTLNALRRANSKKLPETSKSASENVVEAAALVDSTTPHARMDLKSRLYHYKSMHEQVEIQLKIHIKTIENELEKRNQSIKVLQEENQKLENNIIQHKLQLEEFTNKRKKSSKRAGVTFLPGLVVTAELHKKPIEERDQVKTLQDEIASFSAQIPINETEIKTIEAEWNSLNKKLKLFQKIKSKLYLKILKHGLDCRSEGLVWVLGDLIQEGELITYDDLPEFLDMKSKAHLLQKCKLLNQLKELKGNEKVLIDAYKTSFEGNFYNSRFATLSVIPKAKNQGESVNSLGSGNPQNPDRRIKTMNEFSTIPSKPRYYEATSLQSLNDLDLELDLSNDEENSLDHRLDARQLTSLTTKGKASSLANIQEENDYGFALGATVDVQVTKKERTAAKMMSLNDLSAPRLNFNENVYNEAKDVVGRLLRDMKTTKEKTQIMPPNITSNSSTKTSPRGQFLKVKTGVTNVKEEKLRRIQDLQSKISVLIDKINEEDSKEGARLIRDYNPQKIKIDLEFYLTCVLGLAQAEKFFHKYSLKNVKSS